MMLLQCINLKNAIKKVRLAVTTFDGDERPKTEQGSGDSWNRMAH